MIEVQAPRHEHRIKLSGTRASTSLYKATESVLLGWPQLSNPDAELLPDCMPPARSHGTDNITAASSNGVADGSTPMHTSD